MKISTILFSATISLLIWTGCSKDLDKDPLPKVSSLAGYMPEVKGMELTYTVTKGDEEGTISVMKVEDVHDSAGYKVSMGVTQVADIDNPFYTIHNQEKTVSSVGLPPTYYKSMTQLAGQFDVFTHEEHPYAMVIPHKEQLHAVVFPESVFGKWHAENNGEGTSLINDYTLTVTSGEIDSLAKVSIGIGSFDAIRIHFTSKGRFRSVYTDYDGSQTVTDDELDLDEKAWYTLGLGVIKSEETNLKTGLLTVIELTKIRKP